MAKEFRDAPRGGKIGKLPYGHVGEKQKPAHCNGPALQCTGFCACFGVLARLARVTR
jgi:hypothetical protein